MHASDPLIRPKHTHTHTQQCRVKLLAYFFYFIFRSVVVVSLVPWRRSPRAVSLNVVDMHKVSTCARHAQFPPLLLPSSCPCCYLLAPNSCHFLTILLLPRRDAHSHTHTQTRIKAFCCTKCAVATLEPQVQHARLQHCLPLTPSLSHSISLWRPLLHPKASSSYPPPRRRRGVT